MPTVDTYFGLTALPCSNTNTAFSMVTLSGGNKAFCTPQGHAFFTRGPFVFNPTDGSGSSSSANDETGQNYLSYITTKYGGTSQWITANIPRIQSWGWNTLPTYHIASTNPHNVATALKMPYVLFNIVSAYSQINKLGWGTGAVKNLFGLLGSRWTGFTSTGGLTDYRDPNWLGMWNGTMVNNSEIQTIAISTAAEKGFLLGFSADDSDNTHGFGAGPDFSTTPSGNNDFRLGFIGLFLAPTNYASSTNAQIFPDGRVYMKSRFRDMLVTKYGTITALNASWGGSTYTTFDSSGTSVGSNPGTYAATLPADTIGTGNGVLTTFAATLTQVPIAKYSVGIFLNGALVGGAASGNFNNAGTTIFGPTISSGTVNYTTGAVTVTFTSAPPNGQLITANYVQNGWGIGTGFMDEDGRSAHSAWIGTNSVLLTGTPVNVQTDVHALTKDIAQYYASTGNSVIQNWASTHGFTGRVLYLGPTTLGTWSAPPDKYVIQGMCGNIDAFMGAGEASYSQPMLDFIDSNCPGLPIIEGEYRTANAQSVFSWTNSSCTHAGTTVTCTIATPNKFNTTGTGALIDTTCSDAQFKATQVHPTATTATTVSYTVPVSPTNATATCNVFYDDNNVGGFVDQFTRCTNFQTDVQAMPNRTYAVSQIKPYVGYYWWQYYDNWIEELNWGVVTARDNAYNAVENVAGSVPCNTTTGTCGGEGAYHSPPLGDCISILTATNNSVDLQLIANNSGTPPPSPYVFSPVGIF